MNDNQQISGILKDPDQLANCLYFFDRPLSKEMRRQIEILVTEGYLKCTPLMTLLRDIMMKKNDTYSRKVISNEAQHVEEMNKTSKMPDSHIKERDELQN